MTIHEKPPPGGGRDGGSGVSVSSDNSFNPPRQNRQDKFRPPAGGGITCTSLRAEELRGCLVREITCAMANALQAQACLYDGRGGIGMAASVLAGDAC
jgi:hypothetical protein